MGRALLNFYDRNQSVREYDRMCPVTMDRHDWRHATDAPGWINGDECVRCERCGLKAIAPEKPGV